MRNSLRSLAAEPGFTLIAVLTIALGIAANTAIFSVVNAVLLRPLPYPLADRVVEVWGTEPDGTNGNHAAANFLELQRRTQHLDKIAGYRGDSLTIAAAGREPIRVSGAIVTAEYFEVFGSHALLGRVFTRVSDGEATDPRAVISEQTWRDTLASDPTIAGRLLRINGVPHTVVGVMADDFNYPLRARAWVLSPRPVPLPPVDIRGDLLENRDVQYFNAVGLLKPEATVQQAQDELVAIAADLAQRYPRTNAGQSVRLEPLYDRIVGDVRRALVVLLAAVGVVLLIACANVASLLLARASRRNRELAIRTALGASRGRLVRQLLGESVLLGMAGGGIGLLLGTWSIDLLMAVVPGGVPRIDEVRVDLRVAAAALIISLLSAMLFGLLPAVQASKADPSATLSGSGDRATTGGRRRARTRGALVVLEVALTLVLLVTAGLLANSFLRLQRVDPGFDSEQVSLVPIPLPQGRYADGKAQTQFYQQLLDGLKTRGEVQYAAVAFPNPLDGHNARGAFDIEGRPARTPAERPAANIASVSPDYLRAMGISLIAGRHFTEQDREPAPTPIIVNETLARRHWPDEDSSSSRGSRGAIGKRLRFDDSTGEWLTIVGIAADSRSNGLDAEPEPTMYIPYHDFPLPFMSLVVRSAGGPAAAASAVRAEVRRIDPELPIGAVRPLEEVVSESIAEPRFRTTLLGVFAVTALLLAAIGVYGLISYSVAQRTREIGIRVALGARPSQVIGPIVREGMTLAVLGVGLGLVGAFAATKVIAAFLFGVEATDPATFTAVAALLLLVALLASYVPSRRALKVDPLTALRAE